jgi:dTDP-4-dehydrorhamnose 3,5-epimerase
MSFHPGPIHDVIWKPLTKFYDTRGWLCELFRHDEIPSAFHPVMAYVSVTEPGVTRGPHEHREQADFFCFLGPSNFKVYLWDWRPQSPTYRAFQTDVVGQDKPTALIVPAGVVHAYRNVGDGPGVVFNCPNQLYRGPGKKAPVDEIRHEEREDHLFRLD